MANFLCSNRNTMIVLFFQAMFWVGVLSDTSDNFSHFPVIEIADRFVDKFGLSPAEALMRAKAEEVVYLAERRQIREFELKNKRSCK